MKAMIKAELKKWPTVTVTNEGFIFQPNFDQYYNPATSKFSNIDFLSRSDKKGLNKEKVFKQIGKITLTLSIVSFLLTMFLGITHNPIFALGYATFVWFVSTILLFKFFDLYIKKKYEAPSYLSLNKHGLYIQGQKFVLPSQSFEMKLAALNVKIPPNLKKADKDLFERTLCIITYVDKKSVSETYGVFKDEQAVTEFAEKMQTVIMMINHCNSSFSNEDDFEKNISGEFLLDYLESNLA